MKVRTKKVVKTKKVMKTKKIMTVMKIGYRGRIRTKRKKEAKNEEGVGHPNGKKRKGSS